MCFAVCWRNTNAEPYKLRFISSFANKETSPTYEWLVFHGSRSHLSLHLLKNSSRHQMWFLCVWLVLDWSKKISNVYLCLDEKTTADLGVCCGTIFIIKLELVIVPLGLISCGWNPSLLATTLNASNLQVSLPSAGQQPALWLPGTNSY